MQWGFIFLGVFTYTILKDVWNAIWNIWYHPLKRFPGPLFARASTWYMTYYEVWLQKSWVHYLTELHRVYGPVVRVGPNELHFALPQTYNEIYNNINRWDKDPTLYNCFGDNQSSFCSLTYKDAKKRKDILLRMFSRRGIISLQGLIQQKIDELCEILSSRNAEGKSSDLFFGLRCFTMDTITSFCFGESVDALKSPDFAAPINIAMEASLEGFVVFKHFRILRKIVFGLPPWLTKLTSPQMAGLVDLQQMLINQVDTYTGNPKALEDAPNQTIYHELLNPDNEGTTPTKASLYEEAQNMMFAGADTVANTLMLGTYYLLESPDLKRRLQEEVKAGWPRLEIPPTFEELEKLPFLTAVIKESLRVSPGVNSPLLRVVPEGGATVQGVEVPGGTTVGISGVFVHNSERIFENASEFNPDRWLQPDSGSLDKWLVPFSKGPRSCLGLNLAYCELHLAFTALFRRFEMELDGTRISDLSWRDCFLPLFHGRHLQVFCRPVAE